MSNHSTEVVVGGVVLAVAIGFLAYVGNATGFAERNTGYPLTASFRSLEGVVVGTDVKLAGVKIGTVTGIELNPVTFRADTHFEVKNGIDIPDDSAVVVSSEGLLGGNYVEILPGGSPFNFEPGAEIEDTQGAISLVNLLMKFVTGGEDDEGASE
jgi:phospholipid/cholesterol/gamma-HCH transport system substrate-binding protein